MLRLFENEVAVFTVAGLQLLPPSLCKGGHKQASCVLALQRFFLPAHETAFVTPQVLESHDLTAGLAGINFFNFLCNVLLHRVFNRDVLAVRGCVVT